MASTTEELTGQADQLMSALGFFRTGDSGQAPAARSAIVKPAASLAKLHEAVSPKKNGKAGVALKMRDTGDRIDKEFERF
jgi:methyl-accepting chemotaxis protein